MLQENGSLALLLMSEKSEGCTSGYFHVKAIPMVFKDNKWQGCSFLSDTERFNDLEISCQCDDHNGDSYAWNICYKRYSVDLSDAKLMVKHCRASKPKWTKLNPNSGSLSLLANTCFTLLRPWELNRLSAEANVHFPKQSMK
jgi:hypothetical protein